MNEMANIDIQIVFRVYNKSILLENFRLVKMKLPFSFSVNSIGFEAAELSRLIWALIDFYC